MPRLASNDVARTKGTCMLAAAFLLLLVIHADGAADAATVKAMCEQYEPLYSNIDKDLDRWKAHGISMQLLDDSIKANAAYRKCPHSQKGFAAAFINGTAVLLVEPELAKWPGHHIGIWIAYMKVLVQLQEVFGKLIPDVEFVVSSIDRPLVLAMSSGEGVNLPVFRFCKTENSADVLIPYFHFYIKKMMSSLMDQRKWIDRTYPWETKNEVVFGRFSPYMRHLHSGDPTVARVGAGGQQICTGQTASGPHTLTCPVRQHFATWAAQQGGAFDVSMTGKLAMKHHAKYKYLVHLDGQGLSSRLEQLLPLGSLVFKEESGYRGFYHALLKPYVHYIPFWKQRPEDIMDGLTWARQHDAQAREVAENARKFAARYFTQDALSCYWLQLLVKYAELLHYKPAARQQRSPGLTFSYTPLKHYLETTAKQFDGGAMDRLFEIEPLVVVH